MKGSVSPGLAVAAGAVGLFVLVALLFGFTVVSTDDEAALHVVLRPGRPTWPTPGTTSRPSSATRPCRWPTCSIASPPTPTARPRPSP